MIFFVRLYCSISLPVPPFKAFLCPAAPSPFLAALLQQQKLLLLLQLLLMLLLLQQHAKVEERPG